MHWENAVLKYIMSRGQWWSLKPEGCPQLWTRYEESCVQLPRSLSPLELCLQNQGPCSGAFHSWRSSCVASSCTLTSYHYYARLVLFIHLQSLQRSPVSYPQQGSFSFFYYLRKQYLLWPQDNVRGSEKSREEYLLSRYGTFFSLKNNVKNLLGDQQHWQLILKQHGLLKIHG